MFDIMQTMGIPGFAMIMTMTMKNDNDNERIVGYESSAYIFIRKEKMSRLYREKNKEHIGDLHKEYYQKNKQRQEQAKGNSKIAPRLIPGAIFLLDKNERKLMGCYNAISPVHWPTFEGP